MNDFLGRETEADIHVPSTATLQDAFGQNYNKMWNGLTWPSFNYQLISEFVNTMALSESSTQQLLQMVFIGFVYLH